MKRIIALLLLLVALSAHAETGAPVLLYMGQASLRIVTSEDKVIYIDPYAGDAYDLPADLILIIQWPLRSLRGGEGAEPE